MKNCHCAFSPNAQIEASSEASLLTITICLLHIKYMAPGSERNRISGHVHVIIMVKMFSDFLSACLISLNNLDSYVYVNGRWVSPLVQLWHLLPQHILMPSYSGGWIFKQPYHWESCLSSFLTHHSDWVSEVIDDGNMYCCAPVFCCLKMCKEKSPRAWIAIVSAPVAAALSAYRRPSALTSHTAQSWIRHQPKHIPSMCLFPTARSHCVSAVMRTLQGFLLIIIMENKVHKRLMQF